jgi:hypothetical protein
VFGEAFIVLSTSEFKKNGIHLLSLTTNSKPIQQRSPEEWQNYSSTSSCIPYASEGSDTAFARC